MNPYPPWICTAWSAARFDTSDAYSFDIAASIRTESHVPTPSPPEAAGATLRRHNPHRRHRDRHQPARQRVQELPVPPAPNPKQVVGRNRAILKAKRMRVRRIPSELPVRLKDVITRRASGHHDRADLRPISAVAP